MGVNVGHDVGLVEGVGVADGKGVTVRVAVGLGVGTSGGTKSAWSV